MAGDQGLEGSTLEMETTPLRGIDTVAMAPVITVPLGSSPVPRALRSTENTTEIFTKLVVVTNTSGTRPIKISAT